MDRRAAALPLAAALLLGGLACSRTQDLQVTPWFTVRQRAPRRMGESVPLGPAQKQTFYTAVEGEWVRVGEGDRGRVLALDGGSAVLFAPDASGTTFLLYEGESSPQRLSQLLAPGEPLTVSPDGRFLDVPRCEGRGVTGCVSLELVRYDVRARAAQTRVVGLPMAHTGCDFPNLFPIGYDEFGTPHFVGRCEGIDPVGMLVAPRPEGLLVRQRPKPSQSLVCLQPEFWKEALGYEPLPPARFTQLPATPSP